ncbi:MAG: hypothetical protein A3F47_00085 [Candidatus Staskawiczbacteria bacterium RIFCSPHIGHO2_12_FULL_38_11]|uniref:Uncharacterized protein n=1 Tax=Candidatus Staskawiczbacteria bacterium RIFCSPHIGHO2_12_FULL_38_11 TaxID=1802209 RepID=A0A1G2I738_9BACT|nr:MAG: hypothetical protein A3F47_00085 [Candidatus Staskawiczbacteria bacterium RIFCSPHIGHO2_12_FULL_38_11]
MSELYEVEVDALANPHTHLREGYGVMQSLVKKAIEGGADVLGPMPNTSEGLTDATQVRNYIETAKIFADGNVTFIPIVMVNERTNTYIIDQCVEQGIVDCKVYPLDRTTKSHNGVRNYHRLMDVVRHCGKVGMKCHFHPEHPSMNFDNRDAEFAFLPILDMFLNETEAIIVSEHGTDARCIIHWKEMAKSSRFFVTLTAHHLCTNEDETFGDVRAVCKPPIKTRMDQSSLIQLVKENNPWVLAGLDDAAHDAKAKHVNQGRCARGAYTAPFGLCLYAHALGDLLMSPEGIKTFVNFTGRNARALHGLRQSPRKVTLVKKPFLIPASYRIGTWWVEPFWAGREIDWTLSYV